MSSMCPASKGTTVNWMKIKQEMPPLIACKSLLHVKYLWIWGNIHFLWAVIATLGRQHKLNVWSCSVWCVPPRQTQVLLQNLPKKWIWFLKLSSSSLAPSPFLSAFQAQVWSGKSIMVVKWALSKHPSGGTTPLTGPARAWGWIWAPGLIKTHQFCSMGVYTLHDNRWYLDNMTLYVQHIISFPLHLNNLNLYIHYDAFGVCLCGMCERPQSDWGLICRNVWSSVWHLQSTRCQYDSH